MTESVQIIELETQLKEDTDGRRLKELTEALTSDQKAIKRHMDSGLAPDDFRTATEFSVALESATTVVEKVWRSSHGV